MKVYAIKTHYEATEKNDNFAGNVADYVMGECVYDSDGRHHMPMYDLESLGRLARYYIENGYKQTGAYTTKNARAMASAQSIAQSEMERGFWNVTVEWIEI